MIEGQVLSETVSCERRREWRRSMADSLAAARLWASEVLVHHGCALPSQLESALGRRWAEERLWPMLPGEMVVDFCFQSSGVGLDQWEAGGADAFAQASCDAAVRAGLRASDRVHGKERKVPAVAVRRVERDVLEQHRWEILGCLVDSSQKDFVDVASLVIQRWCRP